MFSSGFPILVGTAYTGESKKGFWACYAFFSKQDDLLSWYVYEPVRDRHLWSVIRNGELYSDGNLPYESNTFLAWRV